MRSQSATRRRGSRANRSGIHAGVGHMRTLAGGQAGASWTWHGGVPERDWNPIERPRGGWRFYRDVLERAVRLDEVAMANFLVQHGHQRAVPAADRAAGRQPLPMQWRRSKSSFAGAGRRRLRWRPTGRRARAARARCQASARRAPAGRRTSDPRSRPSAAAWSWGFLPAV